MCAVLKYCRIIAVLFMYTLQGNFEYILQPIKKMPFVLY